MSGKQYDGEIEKNVVDYGYKTANLMYLSEAVKEFEVSEAAAEFWRLYGDIEATVPGFKGVEAKVIEAHLDSHAPGWRESFEKFRQEFELQENKSVL